MSEDNGQPRVYYRVRGWADQFENNQSRALKFLQWVVLHNQLGTDAYAELLDHPNGAAHYGVWASCLQLAACCNPRGTLLKEGGVPHTKPSVARVCRIPADICYEAIDRLVKIGWLEELAVTEHMPLGVEQKRAKFQQTTAIAQHDAVTSRAREKGREGNGILPPQPPSAEGGGPSYLTRSEKKRLEAERQTRIREEADALSAARRKQVS